MKRPCKGAANSWEASPGTASTTPRNCDGTKWPAIVLGAMAVFCIVIGCGCNALPKTGNVSRATVEPRGEKERAIYQAEADVAGLIELMSSLREKRAKLDRERASCALPASVQAEMNRARDSYMTEDEYLRILKECYKSLLLRTDALTAELGVYEEWLLSHGSLRQ
jgi:hypothetical protein